MFEPSCDDRDHVVLLQKVDKMILAAEGEEVDKGLRTRMYAIRNLLVTMTLPYLVVTIAKSMRDPRSGG